MSYYRRKQGPLAHGVWPDRRPDLKTKTREEIRAFRQTLLIRREEQLRLAACPIQLVVSCRFVWYRYKVLPMYRYLPS